MTRCFKTAVPTWPLLRLLVRGLRRVRPEAAGLGRQGGPLPGRVPDSARTGGDQIEGELPGRDEASRDQAERRVGSGSIGIDAAEVACALRPDTPRSIRPKQLRSIRPKRVRRDLW